MLKCNLKLYVMSNIFNLDVAVECVKNIVEYNRCSVCDKLEGPRLSYVCGHTACEDCTNSAGSCLFCLTPPGASKALAPIHSDIETRRAENASELLKICQDTFNVDVYKRSRISKQLQIEKELFPDCIQAPSKYTNKRKSSTLDKENRFSFLPGEFIRSPFKEANMEKTKYIHQWFEKNETSHKTKQKRQPFADLKPNQQIFNRSPLKRRADIILNNAIDVENTLPKTKRKLTHKKVVDSKHNLKSFMKPVEKATFSSFLVEDGKKEVKGKKKNERDESGIEVDMEPIVIEDSQHEVIDKDRLALLAVLEAEKNEPYQEEEIPLQCNEIVNYTGDIEKSLLSLKNKQHEQIKVPFYKKGYLTETCTHCDTKTNINPVKSKDVSITIETNDLITTIKVNNNANRLLPSGDKRTVAVQTDILGLNDENMRIDKSTDMTEEEAIKDIIKDVSRKNVIIDSEDLFTNDAKDATKVEIAPVNVKGTNDDVISNSDEENNLSGVIQVSAEVHRSSDQMDYGVLAEMNDTELNSRALVRPSRGLSPGSTDSSEKENYDPNRLKRSNYIKKKFNKKRKYNV